MKTNQNPRFYGVFFDQTKRLLSLFTLLLVIHACSDADQIGLDLIDSPAYMEATDTLTLRTITLRDDSVATSLSQANVLGIIDDPVFGTSRASIYAETRFEEFDLFLGDTLTLDSIFLVLEYGPLHYGATGYYQTIQVYELSENFGEQDTLYSNHTIPFHETRITQNPEGFKTFFAPADSIMLDTLPQSPRIRIPLSDDFGQKFIDADDSVYENVPSFLEHFKGLHIKVDEEIDGFDGVIGQGGRGSMIQVRMGVSINQITGIELYYSDGDENKMQQFPVNATANHFTHVEHFGYENAHEALRAQVIDQDEAMGDSLLFLNSMGLLRTHIDLPYISQLQDEKWVINKAELIIPVQEGYATERFYEPAELMLFRNEPDGRLAFLDDYFFGLDFFGGVFDDEKMQYVFNVSQYLQQLIDGVHDEEGLTLVTAGRADRPGRVVLHGPGRQENPMRLVVYYSVFD